VQVLQCAAPTTPQAGIRASAISHSLASITLESAQVLHAWEKDFLLKMFKQANIQANPKILIATKKESVNSTKFTSRFHLIRKGANFFCSML
jgi:hypothetical protein